MGAVTFFWGARVRNKNEVRGRTSPTRIFLFLLYHSLSSGSPAVVKFSGALEVPDWITTKDKENE